MSLPKLPHRPDHAHKGDFGRALVIGGSRGMAGAIALTGMAALSSGAGLVTLAIPNPCLETVASFSPCYMTVPLPSDSAGRISLSAIEPSLEQMCTATCVSLGPGLGRSSELTQYVAHLHKRCELPMVMDADALHALSQRTAGVAGGAGPRVLTPHLGELRRLVADPQLTMQTAHHRAREYAARHDAVVLVKGHETLITDGKRSEVNKTGNPGMATGGAGDVLTGVITALICQGMSPFEATWLGAHVHGRAGDLAADNLGQISVTAAGIIKTLPAAFCELAAT